MCGIAGVISDQTIVDKPAFEVATDSLKHRGPDATGIYHDDNGMAAVGHTRLSILDLSPDANQPFISKDRRYVMVYNGEVYNYTEIAHDLNLTQSTTGDTEVILEAFAKEGPQFVHRLNGMFAIAIWDTKEKELYLFRDRMGIKPLYYFLDQDMFLFASELKAIKKYLVGKKKLNISKDAFYSFLHLGYIPEPKSVYQEVKKFPSGHFAQLTNSEIHLKPYWSINSQVSDQIITNEQSALATLKSLLNKSVNSRLISDVPLGAFLSGGIDSSLVTALAAQNAEAKLKTFSIGFHESKFDESRFANQIAKYLQTDHHELILSEKDAIPLVDEILNTYDEPFADSSALPTMLISEMARKEVSVVLSGDGGDEQFLGYGAYTWASRFSKPLFSNPIAKFIFKFGLSHGSDRHKRIAHLFEKNQSIRNHIFSQEQYLFSEMDISHTVLAYDSDYLFRYSDSHERSSEELQAIFDLNYYLKDDLLVKVDRASMKYGLECRVPLLDHELIKFSINLDRKLKKRGQISKYLLKQALFDLVPKQMFNRPKWGFSIPLTKWLKTDLNHLVTQYLDPAIIEHCGFADPKEISKLVKRFNRGESYLYNRLWVLIIWHKWVLENNSHE